MATKKTAEQSAAKAPAKTSAPVQKTTKTPAKATAKKTATSKASPGKDSAPQTPASRPQANHHDIAQLAHKYYTERGHSHGQHVDDWLRAEQELNS